MSKAVLGVGIIISFFFERQLSRTGLSAQISTSFDLVHICNIRNWPEDEHNGELQQLVRVARNKRYSSSAVSPLDVPFRYVYLVRLLFNFPFDISRRVVKVAVIGNT
jgi:hypothetical protein